MDEFVLYAYPFRSRAERIIWALREFKFLYRVIRIDPFKGETRSAEFGALNPQRKVPVLVHEGKALSESLAIMEYLNHCSTQLKLVPTERDAHYRYSRALHFGTTELESYLWIADQATRLKDYYPWPEGTLETALKPVTRAVRTVDGWLRDSAYIAGDDFTLADIFYYQLLTWARKYQVLLGEHADNYLARLTQREAFPIEMKD